MGFRTLRGSVGEDGSVICFGSWSCDRGMGEHTAATTQEEGGARQDTGNGDGVGNKLGLDRVDTCDQQGRG